jgi:hypothetical protein
MVLGFPEHIQKSVSKLSGIVSTGWEGEILAHLFFDQSL